MGSRGECQAQREGYGAECGHAATRWRRRAGQERALAQATWREQGAASSPKLLLKTNAALASLHPRVCVSRSVGSDSVRPHGLQLARLLCPWDSPGKNPRAGCHALLQGIFRTQGSNLGLLHCRQIL